MRVASSSPSIASLACQLILGTWCPIFEAELTTKGPRVSVARIARESSIVLNHIHSLVPDS